MNISSLGRTVSAPLARPAAPNPEFDRDREGDCVELSGGWSPQARQRWQADDCRAQAGWLAAQSQARFGVAPRDLMKGAHGIERFTALAEEWREAHPLPF